MVGRGKIDYTFGEYNQIEQEIMQVRFPFYSIKKKAMCYPLYIGFVIDHYLGNEYDRKTTELFLNALRHDLLCAVVSVLEKVIMHFNNALILSDFISLTLNHHDTDYHDKLLKNVINGFYYCKTKYDFKCALRKFNIQLNFYQHYSYAVLKERGRVAANKSYQSIIAVLTKFLRGISKKYRIKAILLCGSGGRGEFTFRSDIDLLLLDHEPNLGLAGEITDQIKRFFGLNSEIYFIKFDRIVESFMADATLMEDFLYAHVVVADNEILQKYSQIKIEILNNKELILNLIESVKTTNRSLGVKSYLRMVNLILYFNLFCTAKQAAEIFLIKDFLLFAKIYEESLNLGLWNYKNIARLQTVDMNLLGQHLLVVLEDMTNSLKSRWIPC